jgi:hypothetical protein
VVHAREVDGRRLTFLVSGKLWRNSLIMEDRETSTLWSHITGEALDGALAGQQLQQLPSVQTTWAAWSATHPEVKVLRKSEAIKSSRYENYFDDPERTGIFRARWAQDVMPGKTLVLGLTSGPFALAVVSERLGTGEVLNVEVGDTPVVLFRAADAGVRAYRAILEERQLHFVVDPALDSVIERESAASFDLATGTATTGPLKGKMLETIVLTDAYWFAWSHFYPNTEVID